MADSQRTAFLTLISGACKRSRRASWLCLLVFVWIGGWGLGGCRPKPPPPDGSSAPPASLDGSSAGAAAADLGPAAPIVLGRLRGVVSRDGKPVAGVALRLGTAGRVREARSDAAGRYELADIPPGAYALVAEASAQALGA